jgi:hypothetical protein
MGIRLLAPSPCLPALLRAEDSEFDVLVACDPQADGGLQAWADRLGLSEVAGGSRVPLQRIAIRQVDVRQAPAAARDAAVLAARAGRRLALIRLRAGQTADPPAPRRSSVFHLVRDDQLLQSRCVARWSPKGSRLRIAFASDLHIAAIWDDIAGTLERFAPELAPRLLHPNRLFGRLVDELTGLANRGELDVLVLGGDLIDHVYRGRGSGDTNAPLLLDQLASLPVPVFAIPGNHDFRLYPWRPRIYPFSTAGIPPGRARAALRRAGLWDPWPLNPFDLDAVRTRAGDATAGLDHHVAAFASAGDYVVDLGDLRLIFMSTGRDILPRWRGVERGRAGMLLRSIPISYEHPDCEGFTEAQMAALEAALSSCHNAALFFHAPLFNPLSGTTLGPRLERVDPGDDDSLPARIDYERRLFRSGHRHGVFFRNPATFVRVLASFRGALTSFSGHVHCTHAVELDPTSLSVRSVPIAQARSDGAFTLLTAPALGQTATRNGEPPGYLLASFEGGRMTSVERRGLNGAGG